MSPCTWFSPAECPANPRRLLESAVALLSKPQGPVCLESIGSFRPSPGASDGDVFCLLGWAITLAHGWHAPHIRHAVSTWTSSVLGSGNLRTLFQVVLQLQFPGVLSKNASASAIKPFPSELPCAVRNNSKQLLKGI